MTQKRFESKGEIRKCKAIIGRPGGNASPGARNYRVGIPPKWAQKMGICAEERELILSFDGKTIKIRKAGTDD